MSVPESNKTIVIFEDNSSIRQLLVFFFKKRGYIPVAFTDGTDAVEQVRAHAPRLIMMDLIMPGKDGVETCGDLRRAGFTAPILMLTSKDLAEDRDRAMEAGATAYLLKPFNPSALEAAINPLLSP